MEQNNGCNFSADLMGILYFPDTNVIASIHNLICASRGPIER